MTELKITVEAPELAQAINALAAAIQERPAAATPTTSKKSADKRSATPQTSEPAAQTAVSVAPAPIPTVAQPVPVAPASMPTVAQTVPVAPIPATPAPVQPVAPIPAVPAPVQPAAPALTLEAVANAGAGLLERGMMTQLVGLLSRYGVRSSSSCQSTAMRSKRLPWRLFSPVSRKT